MRSETGLFWGGKLIVISLETAFGSTGVGIRRVAGTGRRGGEFEGLRREDRRKKRKNDVDYLIMTICGDDGERE